MSKTKNKTKVEKTKIEENLLEDKFACQPIYKVNFLQF